jgi:hypothetical protein
MKSNTTLFRVKHLRSMSIALTTVAILGLLSLSFTLPALAQVNVLTQHNDNTRSGLNAYETVLTPANVSGATFGVLFSQPVDGLVSAQPLYVSNVNIPGKGIHNVVYAVTLHDSVYAFDADNNTGANAAPLWTVNFLNPAAGITTEPAAELGCISTTFNTEMGILGTPTIDANSGTMYVLVKTKENGTYHFRLHALDITTGFEKSGGPIDVNGSVTGKLGTLQLTTAAKFMMARPGLLLSQGIVYMAFGSNGCDGHGTRGWVVAYDAGTLVQLGIFNDALDNTGAEGNIWMSGGGLASDDNGNIFFSTANGPFDANIPGNHDYGSSVLKIGWGSGGLGALDYFTPYNQAYLQAQDLDIASAGVTMLPDQPGAHPHLIVASGKEGSIYLLDRDHMGQFNPTDNSQIVQFLPFGVGSMFSTAAYWNGNVYFTGQNQGVSQFSLNNGQLSLVGRNANTMCCPHTPSISANGSTNGIVWIANVNGFSAFDASDMTKPALYSISTLGTLAHHNAATIANGKVYVGANLNLRIMGLLGNLQATSGNGQSVMALGTLPSPLQVTATDAYSGAPVSGVTVTFASKQGGVFNPTSAVTNGSGLASTTYTAPKTAGTVTVTATYPNSTKASFTVTVLPGPASKITILSGSKQTAPVQTTYPLPLKVQLLDANNNGIAGGTITFTDGNKGGAFSPASTVTDSTGKAQTSYTTGTKSGSFTFTAASGSIHQQMYGTVTAGPAAGMSVVSGNNQTGNRSTVLPGALVVKVVDQFNNVVPGATVTYNDNGANGSFSASSVTTDANGQASVMYTLPATPGIINITASVSGAGSAGFTETAQ